MSGFTSNRAGRVSQTIHRWAQQDKAHGQSSNIRFDGQRLFSYWAEIGRFYPVESKSGVRIVVLSQKKYSPTTSAHQSCAWSATSQYFRVEFDGWTSELPIDWQKAKKIILAQKLAKLKAECEALKTKRSTAQHLSVIKLEAIDTLGFFNQCFKPSEFPKRTPFTKAGLRILASVGLFNDKHRLTYLAKRFDPKVRQRLEAEAERYKTQAERAEIRRANKAKKAAAQLEEWRNGGPAMYFYDLPIALRVSQATNEIETSRGARVPIPAALALYERLKSPTEPIEGFQVGDFTVRDCYGSNGSQILRVGCHDIPMSEIERIKEQLQ